MIDVIKKAIEEAKKYHIHHYMIACNIGEYTEIKAICKSNFPQIKVIPSGAIEKGKVYLWDGADIELPTDTDLNDVEPIGLYEGTFEKECDMRVHCVCDQCKRYKECRPCSTCDIIHRPISVITGGCENYEEGAEKV